eukprot:2724744-Rhodomonas_salina.3
MTRRGIDDDASPLSRGPHEEGMNQTSHNRTDETDILPVETATAAATCQASCSTLATTTGR